MSRSLTLDGRAIRFDLIAPVNSCSECGKPFINEYFDHEFGCEDRWVPDCNCGEE